MWCAVVRGLRLRRVSGAVHDNDGELPKQGCGPV